MLELLSTTSRLALSLFIIAVPSIALADPAHSGFSIPATTTSANPQVVSGNDIGTVGSGATLNGDSGGDPVITWTDDDTGTVHLTNDGTINSSSGKRAIDTSGGGSTDQSIALINNGTINSSNDGFRVNFDDAGTVTFQNSGTIISQTGQALDFGNLNNANVDTSSVVNIINTATGVIQSNGDDAIHTGDDATINITNAGSIIGDMVTGNGARGIDIDGDGGGTRNISLVNQAGGLIESDDDAIRLNFDVTGGTVTLTNSGTILSLEGQAIDFNAIDNAASGATINIVNTATGVIEADDADGVRPGGNGTVTNYGKIIAKAASGGNSDGVDFQSHAGTVINENGGLIEGAHTGVTGDGGTTGSIATINMTGGTIIGDNGSGVNIDGDGTVYNYGTISGNAIPGSADGDGDGIDIDGKTGDAADTVQIYNYGLVEANGAQGSHGGGINTADGIAFGGGILFNAKGATITSVQRGVFVDDSNGGPAFAATTLTNEGTIESVDDTITFVGTQNDTIINTGTISSQTGMAIQMGDGDDTLDIFAGSHIVGGIDGGAGTDTIILEGGNDTFTGAQNFESLEVKNGTWTLSGTQDYATGITVDNTATLLATGTLQNTAVTVDSGGTLAGNGTIGDLTALDGSVVSPSGGTSNATPGTTLNINGDATFNTGSTYKVAMNVAGQSDDLVATGAATLDGHLLLTSRDGFKLGNAYTVLTADGGVTGSFVDATANAPRLTFTTQTNGNDVDVVASLSGVSFNDLATGGGNQQKVAGALDKASDAGVQSSLLDTLNGLSASDLAKAMNSLSGESHASMTSMSMATAGQFGQAVSGRIGSLRSGNPQTSSADKFSGLQLIASRNMASDLNSELAALCAPDASGVSLPGINNDFWIRGYGSFGQQDGNNDVSGFDYSTGGIAAGYDHHITEDFLAGASIGYSKTTADFSDSSDQARVNSYDIGLYGSYDTGSFYLDGVLNYSLLRNKASRDIDLGGTSDTATSNYDGNRVVAYGEAGYVFKFGDTSLQPLGSLQYTWLGQDSFNEHGAGAADLASQSSNMNSLKSGLGLRLSHRFKTGDSTFFTPEVRARWSHEFLDNQSSSQTGFADISGSNFTVKGIRTARDAALVGAGLTADISSSVAMVLDYDAYISSDQTVHNISGGIKIMW